MSPPPARGGRLGWPRSLADLRRALIPGTELVMVAHTGAMHACPMHRKVMGATRRGLELTGWYEPDTTSWLDWPRASEISFDGPEFTVEFGSDPHAGAITFRLLGPLVL